MENRKRNESPRSRFGNREDETGELEFEQEQMLGAVASVSEVGLDRSLKLLDHVLAGKERV